MANTTGGVVGTAVTIATGAEVGTEVARAMGAVEGSGVGDPSVLSLQTQGIQ